MVADPKSHKYRFLFLITILMIVFLLVGLYFGIRIGAGYYDFYRPDSPYYQNAVSQMSHDSYNNGWDDGFDDGYAQNQESVPQTKITPPVGQTPAGQNNPPAGLSRWGIMNKV